mmetsp:Transcript_40054/g.114091  ORF Transcript_40054/g.114091 Transcript_40054/m.114091 type:complete len:204 (-) Transcript_40054:2800-3411(-)
MTWCCTASSSGGDSPNSSAKRLAWRQVATTRSRSTAASTLTKARRPRGPTTSSRSRHKTTPSPSRDGSNRREPRCSSCFPCSLRASRPRRPTRYSTSTGRLTWVALSMGWLCSTLRPSTSGSSEDRLSHPRAPRRAQQLVLQSRGAPSLCRWPMPFGLPVTPTNTRLRTSTRWPNSSSCWCGWRSSTAARRTALGARGSLPST